MLSHFFFPPLHPHLTSLHLNSSQLAPLTMVFCHLLNEDFGPSPSLRYQPTSLDFEDLTRHSELSIRSEPPNFSHPACAHVSCCRNCGNLQPHLNSIIVAVDGACRGNGQHDANTRSAIGISFGVDSKHNFAQLMSTADVKTNQVAELHAGIEALRMVASLIQNGDRPVRELQLEQVILKSDSEYLVKGMTEWVEDGEGKPGGEWEAV